MIVASLRSLPEGEATSLLHNLRNDMSPETLANVLRSNVRLPFSIPPQILEGDSTQQISPTSSQAEYGTDMLATSRDGSGSSRSNSDVTPTKAPAIWLRTPQDSDFVEHLLELYLCWIHPFHQFFSRNQFIYDMQRGNTEFCSAMLVNAILAFACHFSDRPAARADPNDPTTAGDQFFREAKRSLDMTERSTLTTVQALGIMSIRELSHGRDSSGYLYAGRCVRMALDLGLHLSTTDTGLAPAELEVCKTTFAGAFNLETFVARSFVR